tara:strand:+ start:531 stop:1223 length:693 start_codon:yes stop_codon:yes gene_type:complete
MKFAEMGYRFRELTKQAYRESEIDLPKINLLPKFPKSWLDNFQRINYLSEKYDYNFVGTIYVDPRVEKNRQWVLNFAKENFTKKSYFRLNSEEDFENHTILGEYDFTKNFIPTVSPYWLKKSQKRFIERHNRLNKKRCYFDIDYFNVLCNSNFTLCPAGDRPWSLRFFEVIMSKSIPILEKQEHCGATDEQRNIGYKFYLLGDDYVYRQDWVDYNYDLFLKTHTMHGKNK